MPNVKSVQCMRAVSANAPFDPPPCSKLAPIPRPRLGREEQEGDIAVQRSQSFEPPVQHIEQPACPNCGAPMRLTRIEPDKPAHDKRDFACPQCGHEQSLVVKYR
jgi:DNA-directed RNA polymerase subunit RPC12/RpoP